MCAWVRTIPSTRRGSNGSRAFRSWVCARWPWNRPASSRKRPPAASSRCIEPVTCPAAPQKVRRIPLTSRSAIEGECSEVPGAEQPVAGVAQTGQNVTVLVELAVERGGKQGHLGVTGEHAPHAFRSGDDREKTNSPRARVLEGRHRRDGRAAGGEHRVEQVEIALHLGR